MGLCSFVWWLRLHGLYKGGLIMEIEQIVNLIMNNGMCIVIVGYFMARDWKFMDTLKSTLITLVDTVNTLNKTVSNIETKEN